jgi:hypothetical protein
MSVGFDDKLQPFASGRYQMVIAYQEAGISGTSHDLVAGGYRATLVLAPTDVAVASISASTSAPALQRPASVTDQAVRDAVSKAFAKCAQALAMAQADCPQLIFRVLADHVRWTLNGDPLASATVSFDSNTGAFRVRGNFSMTASYQISGYAYSGDSATTTYDASVLWDGQALEVVTIGGAYS